MSTLVNSMSDYMNGDLYDNADSAMNKYQQMADKYTGNAGYQNSINQASSGAATAAESGRQSIMNAARSTGASKASAAAKAASATANNYLQNFNTQQQNAYKAGTDAVSSAGDISSQQQNLTQQKTNQRNTNRSFIYNTAGNIMNGTGNALSNSSSGILQGIGTVASIFSDEKLKEKEKSPNLTDSMAAIDSYLFKYKPSAQSKYGLNGDNHVGVMAQELESNPATAETVKQLDDGTKVIDAKELTSVNTAAISDMAKEIKELKQMIKEDGEKTKSYSSLQFTMPENKEEAKDLRSMINDLLGGK